MFILGYIERKEKSTGITFSVDHFFKKTTENQYINKSKGTFK